MPCSRKSSTTSQGNSCEASISAARGAIRSRAIVRTRSRISSWSSVSCSQGTREVYDCGFWQTASMLLPSASCTNAA